MNVAPASSGHSRRPWPRILWLLLGALAYYASARLGMAIFSLHPSNISLLWLPAGVGLVMCRWAGLPALPFVFAASFAANAPGMALASPLLHFLHTAVAAGADTLAAWLAATLLARHLPNGLERLAGLVSFVALVCIVPTLVSALLLGGNLVLGGYIAGDDFGAFVGMLLAADSLGILLVYPLVETWRRHIPRSAAEWRTWLLPTGLALGMAYLAFEHFSGLIFLVIPALLYLVFHGREQGAHLSLALAIALVAALASRNMGPFAVAGEAQSHFMLLSYLFTTTLVVLGTSLQHRELRQEIQARQDWQFRANHDPLTGLGNRRLFTPLLEMEMERARRSRREFTVASIDIDHFKRINDTHGHLFGDQVLIQVAEALRSELRNLDVVARVGGEEFAILFPDTPLADARQTMERVRTRIEALRFAAPGGAAGITISSGLAAWDGAGCTDLRQLTERADQCLYEAKRQGRNQVVAG